MHYMLHLDYESFVQYGSSDLKALELTLGELHILMHPSQKKKIECQKVNLFQFPVSCYLNRTLTSLQI